MRLMTQEASDHPDGASLSYVSSIREAGSFSPAQELPTRPGHLTARQYRGVKRAPRLNTESTASPF